MNPIMVVMKSQTRELVDQAHEANKLIQLRDELARLGVAGELRDNNTALLIRRTSGRPGMPVWVFVGYGGEYYSWQSAERRHPVHDVEGAAKELARYVSR